MKRIVSLVVVFAACHRGDSTSAPPAAEAYASDIDKLCDVVSRSGAGEMSEADRNYTIANWLSTNLVTPESHTYLVKIQPLVGEAKAQALDAEAKRVGLEHCALADVWRTPQP